MHCRFIVVTEFFQTASVFFKKIISSIELFFPYHLSSLNPEKYVQFVIDDISIIEQHPQSLYKKHNQISYI